MKWIFLANIVVLWFGLGYVVRRWKGDQSMTISQHAAQTREGQLFYLVLWLVCLPMSWYFLAFEFAQLTRYPTMYFVCATIACLAMLVAAVIPETTGWKVTAHRWAAFTMAYLLLPMTIIAAVTETFSFVARILATIFSLFMVGAIVLAIKIGRHEHPKLLYFQVSYSLCFHASIFAAVFVR